MIDDDRLAEIKAEVEAGTSPVDFFWELFAAAQLLVEFHGDCVSMEQA